MRNIKRKSSSSIQILLALVVAPGFIGCGAGNKVTEGVLPQVGVVTVRAESVPIFTELPGRTSAFRVAEVRARVDGIIRKREFNEGSDIRVGQRLYQIDSAPYQAAYDGAKAALAKAHANLTLSMLLAQRYQALIADNAVSKQEYDNAIAAQLQARADVEAAEAALTSARINLDYTDVSAPIGGRIGKSLVTEGAYVQQSEATPLATLQQLDPIYVDVAQSSAELSRLRRAIAAGELRSADTRRGATVSLILEDGSVYVEQGTLQFSDITVDQRTGTVTLRAIFPNKQLTLLPGMFVHARIEAGTNTQAILVPQQSVTYDQKGQATALVVGVGDKVEMRQLKIDRSVDNQWLVAAGLNAGDRVIVTGLQKIRPGVPVQAVPADDVVASAQPFSNANPLASAVPTQE